MDIQFFSKIVTRLEKEFVNSLSRLWERCLVTISLQDVNGSRKRGNYDLIRARQIEPRPGALVRQWVDEKMIEACNQWQRWLSRRGDLELCRLKCN